MQTHGSVSCKPRKRKGRPHANANDSGRRRQSPTARGRHRSSQTPGIQKNPDGSVEIYFGPKAPAGKESNWVYTAPGKQWVSIFRFYGPEKAVFEACLTSMRDQ
jgi:hypothetical protein